MYLPRHRLFWAVGLGHLSNDFILSMGPVVLAFMSASILPMTNTEIGLLVSASQLVGATSQPAFGVWADRTGGRWLATVGIAWVMIGFTITILVAHFTQQYWIMFVPFVLKSLGSGAVHPVGSLHTAEVDPPRSASNMAYFFLLGQLGLALGPAMAGVLLDVTNIDPISQFASIVNADTMFGLPDNVLPIILFFLLGIPSMLLMAVSIPSRRVTEVIEEDDKPKRNSRERAIPLTPLMILGGLVLLRSLAQPGSMTFLPVLFQQKGWDPAQYGLITSVAWISSGIAGVMFGNLADRMDRRKVILLSLILSAPAYFILPTTDGIIAFIVAILAGGLSGGSHSIIVVMAQQLLPANKGFASGAILGFIFATGALGTLLIGSVSDQIGLETTFQWVAGATLIAGLMSMLLPKAEPPNAESL